MLKEHVEENIIMQGLTLAAAAITTVEKRALM